MGDGGVKINSFMSLSGEDVDYPLQLQKYKARHDTIKSTPPLVGDLWTTQSERVAYNKRELDRWMNSREVTGTGRPIDGLIAPTTPYSSTPKYTFKYYHYTSPYNISDQSVATFPVTTADPSVDVKPAYDPRGALEKEVWEICECDIRSVIMPCRGLSVGSNMPLTIVVDDADHVAGAPVSLQMIGQRLEEEKVLKLVGVAVDALAKSKA